MAITSLTQNQSISSRVTTTTSASLAEQNFSAEGSTWQLQPSAGVQWNATSKVIVGARIAAPGIRILGSSRLTLQTSQFTSPTSTDLVFRDDTATFDYKRPLEASAGLAYHASSVELELDVHYYGALASYDLSHRWSLVGSIESRRLSDEAAQSPIVERRSGIYANAGIAYRF